MAPFFAHVLVEGDRSTLGDQAFSIRVALLTLGDNPVQVKYFRIAYDRLVEQVSSWDRRLASVDSR